MPLAVAKLMMGPRSARNFSTRSTTRSDGCGCDDNGIAFELGSAGVADEAEDEEEDEAGTEFDCSNVAAATAAEA